MTPCTGTCRFQAKLVLMVHRRRPFGWDLTFAVVDRCLPIGGRSPVMHCIALLSGNFLGSVPKRVYVICSRKQRCLAVWVK